MRMWNTAARIQDLDREIAFFERIGGSLILDEEFNWDYQTIRVALLRVGDKYMHIMSRMVYEGQLDRPLADGLQHVVYEVEDLESSRRLVLEAGAAETMSARHVEAGFGKRDVGFFESPGGIRFELIEIEENGVPELP